MGNNELVRNLEGLNMSYLKIEKNVSKKGSKENIENKQARLLALKSEGENLEQEKDQLQSKIQHQQ